MKTLWRLPAICGVALAMLITVGPLSGATHLMENLGRGVVAVRTSGTEAFVSWRVLGTDPAGTSYNLYRSTGGAAAVALNGSPITGGTNFSDATADLTQTNAYSVRAVVSDVEQAASAAFTLPANAPVQQYLRVPLQIPAGGVTPDGSYTYTANDTSVGDLDGDGEYEVIVKWDPTNAQDNSFDGFTGNVLLDAYKLDGTRLWRIDLGRNIRAGAHYTQFIVYDLDGDGKAEIACKTADGTTSGTGEVIGNAAANHVGANGKILTGPEFLTIFNGETGAILTTTNYNPPRGTIADWGDTTGNRVDRFLAGVAYLDGQRPSLIMCRGYYTRAVVAAYDWRGGQLTQRWVFDTGHTGTVSPVAGWRGQGAHSLTIGDVDGDGRDEITYGAAAIDDDGRGLYNTALGHGDALHMSDMDPNRPGLEVWMAHEDPGSYGPNGMDFRDGTTGALIFGVSGQGADIGRACAGDIDPRFLGYEMWGTRGGLMNAISGQVSPSHPNQINFMSWWDGDLLREILDGTTISKWDWIANNSPAVFSPSGVASNNGTKANPALSADILGDWREELVVRESGNAALRIYTTIIPTTHRITTLMHDRQYRLAVAWQNVAYNQPPHPSFYLGDGMVTPPPPDIVTSLGALVIPAPAVSSSNRFDPVAVNTGATSVIFRVTFNTAVTGVDAADFSMATTGTVTGVVSAVAPHSAFAYNVTVGSITGTGTIRLDLNASGTGITGPGGTPIAGGFTGGQVYNRATLAWTNQVSGGLWSNAANWDGGVIADGIGAVPIFGNFDLTVSNTVVLDTPRTISGITFGDTVPGSAASWTIDDNGDASNILTFDTTSGVPAGTVNTLGTGATATINAQLAGADGLAKAGAGVLVLTKPALLTGQVNVTAGTLRLAAGSSITASTVSVSAGGGTLDISGGTFTATGNTTVNGGNGSLIVNAGTATLAAIATNNSANGLIRVNGGTYTSGSINIPRSSDGTPSFGFGFVVTGGTATVNGTIGVGTNNSWGSMSIEGGATSVSGAITLGNQTSASRGGQLRVTGGSLTVANAADGIIVGRRAANVATALFSGGTTTVERFKVGFDSSVNSGSGTLTIGGGTVYLGSGGILANGAGTFAAAVNLQSGVLGAKASWATAVPLALSGAGTIALKAADAADAPFDITLNGPLSGAGGLTKLGDGTLTLTGTNTYTGITTVTAGTLRVDGSLAAGSTVLVNGAATITGTGVINGPVALAATGTLSFAGTVGAAPFNASTLAWSGGGALVLRLDASGISDRVATSGAFTKGGTDPVIVAFVPNLNLAVGNTYTLATFGSTDFSAADFVATGLPPGYAAAFTLTATSLQAMIVGTPFITSAGSASGTFGAPFSYAITAGNDPTSFSATGLPAGLGVDPLTGVISGTPEETGSFVVIVGATNIAGTGTAPLTITIAKAVAPVTLTKLKQAYDGTPKPVAAVTVPAGLTVTFTYDGSATAPTLPGAYAVVGTIDDLNYAGSASGTLVITITALVRHAPTINSADIDGSVQVLLPENVTLNGNALVAGDLLVPGTPTIRLNGHPVYGGTIDSTGAATPTSHTITLNGNAMLSHVVRRVNAIALPTVAAPPQPTGTRSVSLNNPSQSPGDFATIRNLTLNSNVGAIAVPPGTYGNFNANSNSHFVLGVAGSSTPAVYNFQNLTLNSNAALQVVGPVVIVLNGGFSTNAAMGSAAHPEWLEIRIAGGGLSLASNVTVHATIVAPAGTITLNGNASIIGRVMSDRLIVNGNALLAEPPVEE